MIFAFLSVLFSALGISILVSSYNVLEVEVKYSDDCPTTGVPCDVTMVVKEDIEGPVFVYYGLDNFYQNHRRYVKSKSMNQLKGKDLS
jgi:hypothetical protein